VRGWPAVTLANPFVSVTVLPDKGADIYTFIDLESGTDVLFKTPWGLQPPGSPPRPGSGEFGFLQNYEGGWQELFPNTFLPCRYEGREIPLHGEVATLPWEVRIDREDDEEIRVSFLVACRQMPLSLTRTMRLSRSQPTLMIDETVENLSDGGVSFVWGHHPTLGAPFLEAGCRIDCGQCSVVTPKDLFEPATASIEAGQRGNWPLLRRINSGYVDLREITGPDASTHDHAYLTDFQNGWIEVLNPRLGLTFSLEWDPEVFKWLVNWRPFGGSRVPPLDGIYAMGIEPWVASSNLAAAIDAGNALTVGPRGIFRTSLKATLRVV
jgi:hypothetical protein